MNHAEISEFVDSVQSVSAWLSLSFLPLLLIVAASMGILALATVGLFSSWGERR